MLTGRGEWLWRPVSNRDDLQISAFVDENPSGFGFLQRDRDFDHFQDDDQHWEIRPSLWIEPIGDWGPGSVTLVEIPSGVGSEPERHRLLAAEGSRSRPDRRPLSPTGSSGAGRRHPVPARPASSTSRGGRTPGAPANSHRRRFLVEFTGNIFADTPARLRYQRQFERGTRDRSLGVRTFLSRERKSFRVLFDVDPASETYCELRLQLQAQGNPISETWLYRWTA